MSYSLRLHSSQKIQDVSITSGTTENVYAKEINDMNEIANSSSIIKDQYTDSNTFKKKKGKKKNFMKIFKKRKKKSKNLKDKDSNINDDSNYLLSNINNIDSKKYFLSFNELSRYGENPDENVDNQIESNSNNNYTKIEKNSIIKHINKEGENFDKSSTKSIHKKKKENKKKRNYKNNDNINEKYSGNISNDYNIDENYNFEPDEDLKKELEKIKTDIDKIKKKGNLKRIYDDLKYILLFQNEIIDALIDDIRKNKLKTKYDLFDNCTIKEDVNKMILNQITLDLLKFKYINTKLKELIICIYDTKKFNSLVRKIVYNKLDEMRKIVDKDGELTIAKSMLVFLYKQLKYCLEEEVQSYYNSVKNINDDIHNIKKNILNIISDSINDVCSLPDPSYIYNVNEEECSEIRKLKEKKLICPIYANDLNNFFSLYDNVYSEKNAKTINTGNFKNYCFKNSNRGNYENSNRCVLNNNENIKYNIPLRDIYKSYITNNNYQNECYPQSYNYENHLNTLNNPYIDEGVFNVNGGSCLNNNINHHLPLNIYAINKKVNHPYYYVCNLTKKKEDCEVKNHCCYDTSPFIDKIYANSSNNMNKNVSRVSNNNNILMCSEYNSLLNNEINKKNNATQFMNHESNYNNSRSNKYIKYDKSISNDNNNSIRIYKEMNCNNDALNNLWNNRNNKVHNEIYNGIHEENVHAIKKKEDINKGDGIIDIYDYNNKTCTKSGKTPDEMKCERREITDGKNMYTGFEIISSKEEMKKLENFLNDKWGSFKLFEKWIKDCSKWQWIDLKLQREQISSNIELEKLKEEKKKYLEKCINNRIKELWCGRMKGLMNLKLCGIEKKIVKNFSSNTINQNVTDVILELERNTMCFEDLFANFINKKMFNQKLDLLKKYNEHKDKNKHDKDNLTYDKEKIFLCSDSENMKYTHKKRGYVKSLIYNFNKKSQKNNKKYNLDLKKNSKLQDNKKIGHSIKTYISSTDNKSTEKNENNKNFKINHNYKEVEINKQKNRNDNSYIHGSIKGYDLMKNKKVHSLKDNFSLSKIEYIKKDSKNYDKKRDSDIQGDSSSSIVKTKSNITHEEQENSLECSKSVEKDKYEKKRKHGKSNMSTLKKFFNLKRKKKKKEKKKMENLLSESFLLDNKWNSSSANKDYLMGKKKDIVNSVNEKVKNSSNIIAYDKSHSLDKNKCDKERKGRIIEKGVNTHPYIQKEKEKKKLTVDLIKKEEYKTYSNSEMQNNRYLSDFNKLHKFATEKKENKISYSSNEINITKNNEINEDKLLLKRYSQGKNNKYFEKEKDLNISHYDLKNSFSFEGSQENASLSESLKNNKVNEKFNESITDALKKNEKKENYIFEFDVTNIKRKLSEENLSYDVNIDEKIKNIREEKSSITNSHISYSTNKEDNEYEKFSSLGFIKKRNKKNKLNKFFTNLSKFSFKSSKKIKKKKNYSDELILDSFTTASNVESDKKIYKEKLEKKNNNDDFNENTSMRILTNSDLSNKNSLGKKKVNNQVDKIYSYINKLKENKKSDNHIDTSHSDENLNNHNVYFPLNKKGEYEKKELEGRNGEETEVKNYKKHEHYEYTKEKKYDEEYENKKRDDKKELYEYNSYKHDDVMNNYEKKSIYDSYCSSSNKTSNLSDNDNKTRKKEKNTKIGHIIKNDNSGNDKNRYCSYGLNEKNINSSKLSPRFGYSLSNQNFSNNNGNSLNDSSNSDRYSENKCKKEKKKIEEIKENKDNYSTKFDSSANIIDKKEKKKKKKSVVSSFLSNDLRKNKSKYDIKEDVDSHKDMLLSNEIIKYKANDDNMYNNIYFEKTNDNLKDISKSFLSNKSSSTLLKKNQKIDENSSNSHEIIRLSSFKSRSDINTLCSDDQKVDVLSCENDSYYHNEETKKEDYSYYKYVQSILPFGILPRKGHSDSDSRMSGKVKTPENFS
ncbi:conserved Plasmodium protein, unknown function [Plasmodium relictum]|uniref:Uncharacterized protein n=1 Tax=Plasmodium relictum TaxID=85471 RepID=A0A1J1HEA0_PLARL|nr:conserved Plasmodium protein, unknown function [Plasmodium relictum]CRH02378.1 conserved Plasmodium protein, unknown function [Plasmodium relictum]